MIEFNPALFFYQLGSFIVFAVVVTVIYRVYLAPVLRERRERIEGDMARAAAARDEAGELKAKYETKMAEVGREASAIIKRVNDEAARHREELMDQARHQAESLVRQAEELIAARESHARAQVQEELADIAVQVAAKVLGETRTAERERALAEKFLNELTAARPLTNRPEA
jgi:F-type H+-transporting ATPase subunit b